MYVNRSPGLGSFFTEVRNVAENAVATYYPALRPFVAKPPAPARAPAVAPVSAPAPAPVRRQRSGFRISTPVMIAGGIGLAGLTAFLVMKKKGRK